MYSSSDIEKKFFIKYVLNMIGIEDPIVTMEIKSYQGVQSESS
jgi:hypothetical protein